MTLTVHKNEISSAAIRAFANRLTGRLIRPVDAEYNEARAVWNGMIDKYPALIAKCVDSDDVILAVKFARAQNLSVSVRGGGHNVAGHAVCDDGLVIDLTDMKQIEVDADAPRIEIINAEVAPPN